MGRDDEAVENRAAKPRRSSTDRHSSRSSETGLRRRHHPRGNPDGPGLEEIAEDDVSANTTGASGWEAHVEQSSVDLTTGGYDYYTWTEQSLGAQAQGYSSWGEGQPAGDNLEQGGSQDYPTGDYYSTSPPNSRSSAPRPRQDEPGGRSSTDSGRQDYAESSAPPPRKPSSRPSKSSETSRDAGHRRRRDVAEPAGREFDQSHQGFSGTPAENMEYRFAAGDYPVHTDANVISDLPLASSHAGLAYNAAVYDDPHPKDDYVESESKRHHGNSSSKATSQSKYNISGRRKKSRNEADDEDFLPDRASDPRRQDRELYIEDDSRDRASHARSKKTVSSSKNTGSKSIDASQRPEELEYYFSEYQGQQSQGTEYHGPGYQGVEYQGQEYQGVEHPGEGYQSRGHGEADYQPGGLAELSHGGSDEQLGIEHGLDQLSLNQGHQRATQDTAASYTSDAETQAVSMSLERYEIGLFFRTPQDLWEAAQGYYDSANFLGPMVKLNKILTMGYKETHIDFNQMVHFNSLGGSGTTCGVISLTYRKSQTKVGKTPSTASRDVVGTFHVVSQSDWWAYDVWFGPDISHIRNPVTYVGSVSYSREPVTQEEREQMQDLVKKQRKKVEEENQNSRKEKDKRKREKKDKKKG